MYPYKHRDSFKKSCEDKLPDRCEFFSALKHECISEIDYLHAINNWNVFKGDYHHLYLKVYVLLLADVFEKLINKCSKY